MSIDCNISTPSGSLASEAMSLLHAGRQVMLMWMAREMAKEGVNWTPPKPPPCVTPVIIDPQETSQQMGTVRDSGNKINECVSSVNTELDNFYNKLRELANSAQAANFEYQLQGGYCWDCEEIAEFRRSVERALCKLSAEVAVLQVAVQGVLGGYYLRAICPTYEPPYTKIESGASQLSDHPKTPAKGKRSA